MPTYSSVGKEIAATINQNAPAGDPDIVRRRYARQISTLTGRPLLIYAVDFIDRPPGKPSVNVSIDLSDIQGFDEALQGVQGPELDVVVHSPGGSPEACESIVKLLRSRFNHIRFIIPGVAKSAATMLVMSGNEILMDNLAELGPIDPQLVRQNSRGVVISPAQAILDQFDQAKCEVQGNPDALPAWYPILQEMAPSLLAQCHNAIDLSKTLVADWLRTYMFAGDPLGPTKAAEIAGWVGNHNNFRSHGRRIDIQTLVQKGVSVSDLATDPSLYSNVRGLYHSINHTFDKTGCYRFYENSNGIGQYRLVQVAQIAVPPQQNNVPVPVNRQQRRQQQRQSGRP